MNREALLQLYVYNQIANDAIINAADALSEDDFSRAGDAGQRSVQQILLHMANVESFYLAACRGEPFTEYTLENVVTVADVRAALVGQAGEIQRYIESLDETDLQTVMPVTLEDMSFDLPRWKLFLQPIMHSAQHRGELSLMLGQMGRDPQVPDVITHFVLESGQQGPFA